MGKWDRDITDFHLGLVNTTDLAILVETEQGKEVWIPKSKLVDWKDNEDGTCYIEITEQDATEFEIS